MFDMTRQLKKSAGDDARERILDEAEALFAQKGFRGVTVREITAAAGVNVAAVNYYFQNKKNLYLQVFRERWLARVKRTHLFFEKSLVRARQENPMPDALVRALAESMLLGPFSEKERQIHGHLIAREMTQPTEAFDMVVEEAMRPFMALCSEHLKEVLPENYDPESLYLDLFSLFGVVLYFNIARPLISRVTDRVYDEAFMERIIAQIAQVSSRGLFADTGRNKKKS